MILRWFDELPQSGLVYESHLRVQTLANLHTPQPLLKNFAKSHILSDGLPIYRRLQADDQDSVRLLTIEDLIVIAQQLTPAEVKEQLLKQIRHSIADKSWRVRYMAASHFNEV
jgi:serine/threonine-protein phosphatase 2A regulatory subunit A